MAKVCEGCGKKPRTGHLVSHSNKKTKRRFMPNLFQKRLLTADRKKFMWVKICTTCLRTLTKYSERYGVTELALKAIQKKKLVS